MEAEGRLRQQQGKMGGERKAQAATGKDGSRRDGTCNDRERWKAQAVTGRGGWRREGSGSDREK